MSYKYSFPAVKGKQANKDYYVSMVPLKLLKVLFRTIDEGLLPEYRAQRKINENRIPEIAKYILTNKTNYVFSALSASVDGEMNFIESRIDSNVGLLNIDMSASFLINDGQHRRAAIIEALKEDQSLGEETIAVVFFKDEGLKRSQQMFADLNKNAMKPSRSLSTLYDDRDELAIVVKEIVSNVPFLTKYIDKENDNLGKNSAKFFTLDNFLRANRRIVKEDSIVKNKEFLIEYWTKLFDCIDEWRMLKTKEISKKELRENYILTLGVTLNSFGKLGKYFIENKNELYKLERLNEIDWLRTNINWRKRIINDQGKIINNEDAIIKLSNYFKKNMGIALSKEEIIKEKEIER